MDSPEPDIQDFARPRTATVVVLLVGAALILSYLAAYAVTNVLVAADVIPDWSRDRDPRPRWMAIGFLTLTGLFVAAGATMRVLSRRQLRSIDQMEETDEHRSE